MTLRLGVYSVLSALVLLVGCAATRGPQFQRLSAGVPAESVGWVMFSFTTTGPAGLMPFMEPTIWLHGVGGDIKGSVKGAALWKLKSGEKVQIPWGPPTSGPRIAPDDPSGVMVLLELPAGRYEFDRYEMSMNSSPVSGAYSSAPSFRYAFEVVPGKVNYIGSLNLDFADHGVHFDVYDERRRDEQLSDTQFAAYSRKEKIWFVGTSPH